MRIHYLLHASFEKIGVIQEWIDKHGYQAKGTHTYRGDTLPDVSEFDMLIVMGGPQSAVTIEKYPYLQDEVALLQKALQANKAILGVCLGSQLLGASLGAKAEQSPHKEIGVYPVNTTEAGEKDPVFQQFSKQFDVMHWHNDMPGLPADAVLLAASAGCPRQAFRYGDRAYGLQFHMELTPTLVKEMVEHCSQDLHPAPYVQSANELLAKNLSSINEKMHVVLDYLAERALKN